jgi:deoxyadenosine/deoxycytidine kinase
MEQEMFNNLYEFLLENVYPRLSGIIFLDTSVDECIRRITKRNRTEEASVDKDYLEQLHLHFLDIINTSNVPTLIVDGNYDINGDIDIIRDKVGAFMKKQMEEGNNE